MRTPPIPLPPRVWQRGLEEDTRTYCFLTWVFGGGVKVRDHEKFSDPVTPVRVASIRGQLRFWWRACNPSRCTSVAELREREGQVWGTTSQASAVTVEVTVQPAAPRQVQVYRYVERNGKRRLNVARGMEEIAYGAFPLQPSREAQGRYEEPGTLYDYGESEFTLRFVYPTEVKEDVLAALWAWESFGGLGGRTRRGFGAIGRKPARDAISELEKYRHNPRIDHVPSLAGSRFAVSKHVKQNPIEAWKDGLGRLQKIRQGAGVGRNDPQPGTRKPAGRSRWPEPDEIRSLTGKAAPLHSQPIVTVQRFPRAAFGMPIVFHFHPGSRDEPGSQGDPGMKPLQLQPDLEDSDRFASPLVIRPIPGAGGYSAAALALASDLPPAVFVADKKRISVRYDLDPALAAGIPALKRNSQVFTDPIELFLWELTR
jgi:CRISPR-associated protein Cmr1